MKKLFAIIIAAMLVVTSVSMVACDGDWLFGTHGGDLSGDVSGDISIENYSYDAFAIGA